MKFNHGSEASFFKILLMDSDHYLRLPTAFAEKYLEKSNKTKQKLVLKTQSGVKWRAEYWKIEDRHYFMHGWLDFMRDNRLQIGDFLVFWLQSPPPKPVFQVFPYAPNGCLKHPDDAICLNAPAPTPVPARGRKKIKSMVKEPTNDEDDDDDDEKMQQSMVRSVKTSYTRHMPITKSFYKGTGMDGYSSVRLKNVNDEGKTWEVTSTTYGSQQAPCMTRGWSEFRKDNKIMIGNRCEFLHLESNLLHVRVFKRKWKKGTYFY